MLVVKWRREDGVDGGVDDGWVGGTALSRLQY